MHVQLHQGGTLYRAISCSLAAPRGRPEGHPTSLIFHSFFLVDKNFDRSMQGLSNKTPFNWRSRLFCILVTARRTKHSPGKCE